MEKTIVFQALDILLERIMTVLISELMQSFDEFFYCKYSNVNLGYKGFYFIF